REIFIQLMHHLINYGEPMAVISLKVFPMTQKTHLQICHSHYIKSQGAFDSLIDGHLVSSESLALSVDFDLGLYTACRLIEKMEGRLSAYEQADHQMIFAIYLKTYTEDEEQLISSNLLPDKPVKASSMILSTRLLPPRKVLIVEDDKLTQSLLESILRNSGIDVLAQETAKEGLVSCLSYQPDLVIIDLGLPDYNGFELIKRMRQSASNDFYAIAFSANNHKDVQATAIAAGFDSFLAKPLAPDELCKAMRIG
ncbi:MAG: response regulator, partial [Proteobacteria bacterium]|nr:response regulator [Pseudomonadota bacterium]